LQYSGRLVTGLSGILAYTWSHSIDNGSADSSVTPVPASSNHRNDRGSSDFDSRHNVSLGSSYEAPRASSSGAFRSLLSAWRINPVLRFHTGFPIDISTDNGGLGVAATGGSRPDLVPGVPIWLNDPSAPGGSRLNPNAFRFAPNGQQGSLGRNVVSGRSLFQLDVSLNRDFKLSERISLGVGVSLFNVLNRPGFADPVSFLSNPWFGRSTSMQNLMYGSGNPNSGLTPFFQNGGPRSGELKIG
jgi:hypothetical protein